MKITKEIHPGWLEFEKLPKELQHRLHFGNMFGKYHYHYENENGIIGLIRIECGVQFTRSGNLRAGGKMWEACGVLDYHRFRTRQEAEKAIYKALKEKKHEAKQTSVPVYPPIL